MLFQRCQYLPAQRNKASKMDTSNMWSRIQSRFHVRPVMSSLSYLSFYIQHLMRQCLAKFVLILFTPWLTFLMVRKKSLMLTVKMSMFSAEKTVYFFHKQHSNRVNFIMCREQRGVQECKAKTHTHTGFWHVSVITDCIRKIRRLPWSSVRSGQLFVLPAFFGVCIITAPLHERVLRLHFLWCLGGRQKVFSSSMAAFFSHYLCHLNHWKQARCQLDQCIFSTERTAAFDSEAINSVRPSLLSLQR